MEDRVLCSVYSLKMAKFLISRGHDLISVRPMRETEDKVIFRFENTEKIREDMAEYIEACDKYFGGKK